MAGGLILTTSKKALPQRETEDLFRVGKRICSLDEHVATERVIPPSDGG
jgi:hypothetical protein